MANVTAYALRRPSLRLARCGRTLDCPGTGGRVRMPRIVYGESRSTPACAESPRQIKLESLRNRREKYSTCNLVLSASASSE